MRRSTSFVVFCAALLFVAACRDMGPTGANPAKRTTNVRKADATPGTCTTPSNIISLINTVFGAGSPNANSALGKFDNLNKLLQKGDLAGAQDQARNLVSFIQTKVAQGGLPGTTSQITLLINSVLCYSGLLDNAFLIYPTDQPQDLVSSDNKGGVHLDGNPVNEPSLLTIDILPPGAPSPLITKLDQYPAYVILNISSALTKPAVVGVCPASGIPSDVRARLKLGHQATAGFEIPPPGDATFLDCSGGTAQSRSSGWLNRLASYVSPKPLYAKQEEFSRGVGATVTEFSPFGPVDPELSDKSGVGSTVTEFNRIPTRGNEKSLPSVSSPSTNGTTETTGATLARTPTRKPTTRASATVDVNGKCTAIDATAGQAVEPECRPGVVITTAQGTILSGVPVNWAIDQGGGTTAPQLSGGACGTFGSAAATTTDANGKVTVCWTLGATGGTNTITATPVAGGDAPNGVTFANPTITFTATAKITPTVTAIGGTFPYDGSPHAGTAGCSNGLTPTVQYTGGAVPVNANTYTMTVTCGGTGIYNTAIGTATIIITAIATTSSVSCPPSVLYTGTPRTPCTGGVTTPPAAVQPLTPTYTNNTNAGTATATVTYAGGGNYLGSTASTTFQILYVQSGCFASPVYSVMPETKSYQRKGSNLPVKCTLLTASGAGVGNATGNLVVTDLGVNGVPGSAPACQRTTSPYPVAFSGNNVFKSTSSGNYAYGLDTSPAGFVIGHFYCATATWNDGSTTKGYFFIK